MSELIEIHQLDYKACSLTYSEGACTASSSSRPAGETVAAFNGSSSRIVLSPSINSSYTKYDIGMSFVVDGFLGSSSEMVLYNEFFVSPLGSLQDQFYISIANNTGTYSVAVRIQESTVTNSALFTVSDPSIDFLTVDIALIKNGSSTNIEFSLNNGAVQTATINKSLGDNVYATIAAFFAQKFDGKIKDFTIKKDGVLVRDLPLLTNADDLTGNTTPVATDVFTLTCPSIIRDVAEFNGVGSRIEYALQNNFGAYIPFQTDLFEFECKIYDLPITGNEQLYFSTGTNFMFAIGGSSCIFQS